jgi:hypothetical protein
MQRICQGWRRRLVILMLGGWMWQAGCIRAYQREIEVLLAPAANPLLIRESFLVDLFGPAILTLF